MFHLLQGLIELVGGRCVITCSIACGSYTQLMFCSVSQVLVNTVASCFEVIYFNIFRDMVIQCIIYLFGITSERSKQAGEILRDDHWNMLIGLFAI